MTSQPDLTELRETLERIKSTTEAENEALLGNTTPQAQQRRSYNLGKLFVVGVVAARLALERD